MLCFKVKFLLLCREAYEKRATKQKKNRSKRMKKQQFIDVSTGTRETKNRLRHLVFGLILFFAVFTPFFVVSVAILFTF